MAVITTRRFTSIQTAGFIVPKEEGDEKSPPKNKLGGLFIAMSKFYHTPLAQQQSGGLQNRRPGGGTSAECHDIRS